MAKRDGERQRFEQAVALYRAGEFVKAGALFRAIAAGGGALAAKARAYLARIDAAKAGTGAGAAARGVKRPKTAKRRIKKGRGLVTRKAAAPRRKTKKKATTRRAAPTGGRTAKVAPRKRGARPSARPSPAPAPASGRAPGGIFNFNADKRQLGGCAGCVAPDPGLRASVQSPQASGAASGRLPARGATNLAGRRSLLRPKKKAKKVKKGESPAVTRTPHMDIRAELPIKPGTAFDVEIFADQEAPAPGEISTAITVPAGTRVDVHLLVSEHFLVDGAAVKSLVIDAGPVSERVSFRVAAKPADRLAIAGTPSITALFMNGGRPCGMVRRDVSVGDISVEPTQRPPARVEVVDIASADLHVTVVAKGNADRRTFQCLVQTPHLDAYREPVSESWVLQQDTDRLVQGFMKQFTAPNTPAGARIASLRGAGRQLFGAAPKNFQAAYWALIDAGAPVKDIAVVSEELYIPWELMIPYRKRIDGTDDERAPLGLQFRIGRWTTPDMVKPLQKLNLVDTYVIAPNYADARKRLRYAQDEANFVVGEFNGVAVTPAGYDDVEQKLKGGRTLLHFVCHGADDSPGGIQTIDLENNQSLTSVEIGGIEGLREAFSKCRPIIFLNACEVGRLAPALIGLGGFAAAFIDVGASAVIAPLWSVKDEFAHQVAMEFYSRVKAEPTTPFAEILRTIRAKAYDRTNGEDTYAAYCFYGDPAGYAERTQRAS
jgi:CHAT domain